jgi:leucyl aminopeptidase
VAILEVFRTLLTDSKIATGQALNTIEFHWYAAEEVGLLGSQAIFQSYAKAERDISAMLQQDM